MVIQSVSPLGMSDAVRRNYPKINYTCEKETAMSDAIFKKVELVGTSETSIEDAVNNALAKAAQTVRNIRWFEVLETRGSVEEGKVGQWQVTLSIGFRLE